MTNGDSSDCAKETGHNCPQEPRNGQQRDWIVLLGCNQVRVSIGCFNDKQRALPGGWLLKLVLLLEEQLDRIRLILQTVCKIDCIHQTI